MTKHQTKRPTINYSIAVFLFLSTLLWYNNRSHSQESAAKLSLALDEQGIRQWQRLRDAGFKNNSSEDSAWDLCNTVTSRSADDYPQSIGACFFVACSAMKEGFNCYEKTNAITALHKIWQKEKYWKCP